MNEFLIPANSKKSMLYFGLFNKVDLIMFISGVCASLLLLTILPTEKLLWAILALLPGVITGLLVIPIPNYHNIRTIIKIAYEFYTTRQKFIWKGWDFNGEDESSKK